jgi:hypothetical protein
MPAQSEMIIRGAVDDSANKLHFSYQFVNFPSEDSLCTRFVYYLDHDQSFVYTHVHDHNSVRKLDVLIELNEE